jgi:hypothetical protein
VPHPIKHWRRRRAARRQREAATARGEYTVELTLHDGAGQRFGGVAHVGPAMLARVTAEVCREMCDFAEAAEKRDERERCGFTAIDGEREWVEGFGVIQQPSIERAEEVAEADVVDAPKIVITEDPAADAWRYDSQANVLTVSLPKARESLGREPRDDAEIEQLALDEWLAYCLAQDGEG